MRDRIKERLTEDRSEALNKIKIAESNRKGEAVKHGHGPLNSDRFYVLINEDRKTSFAEYMDQSADFIRRVAGSSFKQYADDLRDSANELKREIIDRIDKENLVTQAMPFHSVRVQSRNELDQALDKFIKHKVEDFELGEGKDMNATTQNTVNIINSNISNAVVQITQSGKDAISKDTAQKLKELINSDEIKGLSEQNRLDVLDQAEGVINELGLPVTDDGKVVRGLKRLGKFISSVASETVSKVVTELVVAYARAHGIAS